MHVLMISRLWGNPNHLWYLRAALEEKYSSDRLRVLVATKNSHTYTYDGIEVGAERVAQEIEEELEILEGNGHHIKKLSMVGYSLGGLISRYVCGLLYSRGLFKKIEPINFTTFATPHLGVRAPITSRMTPVWNALGARTISSSGRQLFLIDSFRDEGRPLLSVLADPSSIFIQALSLFKKRVLYANIINDRSAPYYTTSISDNDPYVDLDAITIDYVKGYEPVILHPEHPVALVEDRQQLDLYTRAVNGGSIFLTKLPLFLLLGVLVPVGTAAYLVNSGIQSIRSSQRIRLHGEGKSTIRLENYRIPLMIENAKSTVEGALKSITANEGEEYLSQDGVAANGLGSSTSEDSSLDMEKPKLVSASTTDPADASLYPADFPVLALARHQFEMIKSLNNVGFTKFPVHIHKVSHSHAAIIVRMKRRGLDEGKIVIKHWLDESFEI